MAERVLFTFLCIQAALLDTTRLDLFLRVFQNLHGHPAELLAEGLGIFCQELPPPCVRLRGLGFDLMPQLALRGLCVLLTE